MKLTDVFKYMNSLYSDEMPAAGYMYLSDSQGGPKNGTLIPMYSLLDDKWKFCPLSGLGQVLNSDGEAGSETMSVSEVKDLYRLSSVANEKQILPSVAGSVYNLSHRGPRWEELESYQRDGYISDICAEMNRLREYKRGSQEGADMNTALIRSHLDVKGVKVMREILNDSVPSILYGLVGSPLFVGNDEFNQYNFFNQGEKN